MKRLMIFLLMLVLLVGTASAFLDTKTFNPQGKNYGEIKIKDWLFLSKADYRLMDYGSSVINVWAEGDYKLYEKTHLFTGVFYKDVLGRTGQLRDVKFYIWVNESYEVENPIYEETCQEVYNSTNQSYVNQCKQNLLRMDIETKYKQYWKEYNKGDELPESEGKWKLEAKRKPNQKIDFVLEAHGKTFDEWAWWNSNWENCKTINITTSLSQNNAILEANLTGLTFSNITEIRIVNQPCGSDGEEVKNTVLQNGTDWAYTTWLANLSGSNVQYSVYYNNPTNPTKSEELVDDHCEFSNNALCSGWTTFGSTCGAYAGSFTNGIWTVTCGGAYSGVNVGKKNPSVRFNVDAGSGSYKLYGLSTATDNSYLNTVNHQFGALPDTRGSMEYFVTDGSGQDEVQLTGADDQFGNWVYFYGIYPGASYTNSNGTIWNNAGGFEADATASRTASSGSMHNYVGVDSSNNQIDYIRAYDLEATYVTTANMPSFTLGVEENTNSLTVTLNSPENNYNTTSSYVLFNCSATDETGVENLTLIIDETDNQTINGGVGQNLSIETSLSLNDGEHNWTCRASDGSSGAGDPTTASLRYFTIDTALPELESHNVSNIVTTSFPANSTWWFNVTDDHIGSCWYYSSENSTNTSTTCNGEISNTPWSSEGTKTLYYCANDTFGNEQCNSTSLFVYGITLTQLESKDPVGEGESVTYTLWINLTDLDSDWAETNATFKLNNTNYQPSKYTYADSMKFIYTHTFTNTSGAVAGLVHPWNWTYYIQNSTYELATGTTSTSNTTVYKVAIDDCSAYGTKILNYTLLDEEYKSNTNPTALANQTIEIDVTVSKGSYNWEYSKTETGTNVADICVPNGLLNSSNYNLDVVTRFKSQDHVVEFNYIDGYNLTNSGNPQNINLYDLFSQTTRTEYSTSFLVNYQDENYLPVQDAIIDLWRYYVGDGEFLSVEHGKTDADGNTRLHFVTEDVRYKAYVRVDGEVVYTSPEFLALCQASPCQINLQKESGVTSIGNYSQIENLAYSVTLDQDTKTVTLSFATSDGSSADMFMNVTQWDAYGNTTVCSDSASSSGGTLSCTVPTSAKNTTYLVNIWKDSESLPVYTFDLQPNAFETFGYTGVILTAIVYLTLVLMAVSSGGIAVLIFGIIGLVGASMLTLFSSGSIIGVGSALMWLIVAIIIVAVKIANRRSG